MFFNIKNSQKIITAKYFVDNRCAKNALTKTLLLSFVTFLLLIQTTNLLAANADYDSQFTPMAGMINRASAEMSTIRNNDLRTKNINGVRYEVMEVRDELNDLISNPDDIEESPQPKETIVKVEPTTSLKQKTEPTITKTLQAIVKKPVASQILRVLPTITTEDSTSNNKNLATIVKNRPIYNKHDINGDLLNHDTEQWSCIDDTKNGLMWEVKSKENLIRNSNNLYSWFKSDEKLNNGIADGGRCQGNVACDTNAYVQAMNKQNFCGHNDWRLPTRDQMQTLVHLNNNDNSAKINKK